MLYELYHCNTNQQAVDCYTCVGNFKVQNYTVCAWCQETHKMLMKSNLWDLKIVYLFENDIQLPCVLHTFSFFLYIAYI